MQFPLRLYQPASTVHKIAATRTVGGRTWVRLFLWLSGRVRLLQHSNYEQYGRSHRADGLTWNAAGSGNTSPLPKLNDSSQQPGRMADTCTGMPPSFCCAIGMAYEFPNW